MTLDEIEKLASHAAESEQRDLRDILECRRMEALNTLTGAARGATETAANPARAVMAMLPVVRVAIGLYDRAQKCHDRPYMGCVMDHDMIDSALWEPVNAMHNALRPAISEET